MPFLIAVLVIVAFKIMLTRSQNKRELRNMMIQMGFSPEVARRFVDQEFSRDNDPERTERELQKLAAENPQFQKDFDCDNHGEIKLGTSSYDKELAKWIAKQK